MSLIKKSNELVIPTTVKMMIYGQAGMGKSTVALSAPKPLLLDFDNGVKRMNMAHLENIDTVQVTSWSDVQQVLQEDLSAYQTIVVDTIGKMMDFIKKGDDAVPTIELIANPDILAEVAALPSPPLCVGFAAESRDLAAYAEKKRKSKKIPLIVGNLIQDGFGGDDNRLVLFDAHGETPLPPGSKLELSRRLVAHIALMLEKH